MPEMNTVDSFQEGVETEVDSPLFGGKAKVLIRRRGSDTMHVSAQTDAFGHLEFLDEYTRDGIHSTMTSKEHDLVFKEFWPRDNKITGWYRFTREENLKGFLAATGES